ncbi:type I methionyl aminopeptidase [Rickettsiales endosymbiont of Stachyamoeba lipophora]|uniref:type I methionyl aminopeptidase n=1 Tax=Rickettsiales endosymbiont of Stachyamoeba lipophora TaxID=2486578 RepID=UPI000F652E58|nr:type I methionyl aminopeptidase [Rickettsiales endosymbiont of Stachyamoeba lipophora]AZL15409.1 type I methionyl aminopeptidase [Rickettsiales endosymbiont of Stachyamoeba lipophora]
MTIKIHKPADFEKMRVAGKLAAQTLDMITEHVQPGITTNQLNEICHEFIIAHNAIPAPLNYKGYPKSICTSVNHVVCHGIPDDTQLKNGDIINIDVTVIVDGWYGDTSRMYWAGEPKVAAKRLTQVTYDAMMLGIEQIKPGNTLGDIGYAIQTHAEKHHYSIVRDFCGHGIGQIFHDEPNVLHYGRPGKGTVLEEGMLFTVEPMINIGKYETIIDQFNGWTARTRDKSLSAQFEHTVGVTKDGVEIFTISPKGLKHPNFNI